MLSRVYEICKAPPESRWATFLKQVLRSGIFAEEIRQFFCLMKLNKLYQKIDQSKLLYSTRGAQIRIKGKLSSLCIPNELNSNPKL